MGCGELIKRISDIFLIITNKLLESSDITLSQIKLLVCLYRSEDGSATLKELERQLGSSQSTVAGIAARLAKKGFVDEYADETDRRIKHVRLSASGRELCELSRFRVQQGEQWLLKTLSETEQTELHRLLLKVYRRVSQ